MNYTEVLKKRINTRKNALKNKGRQSVNTCLKYNQTYNICEKNYVSLFLYLKKHTRMKEKINLQN